MTRTTNYNIELLATGQAQPEVTINDALVTVDAQLKTNANAAAAASTAAASAAAAAAAAQATADEALAAAGSGGGGSGDPQIWQVTIDDTTTFATESLATEYGPIDFPALALAVPAGCELVKIRWNVSLAHPQIADFSYFMPHLKIASTVLADFQFASSHYGDVQPLLWAYDGAGASEPFNPDVPIGYDYRWFLDAQYEEVKVFTDIGGAYFVGGINKYPNAPSIKAAAYIPEQALSTGAVLFKGFGRPPNVAYLRADGFNLAIRAVGGNCTLKLSTSRIASGGILVPTGSIELDYVPTSMYPVASRPDADWTASVADVLPGLGYYAIAFTSRTVFTVEVLSTDSGVTAFGTLGFGGGEPNASFDA